MRQTDGQVFYCPRATAVNPVGKRHGAVMNVENHRGLQRTGKATDVPHARAEREGLAAIQSSPSAKRAFAAGDA
jgi:hypothetical protein